MKQLHFVGKQKKATTLPMTSPVAQKAMIHACFRCQICYSPTSLKPYSRLGADLSTTLGDVLILCQPCHELASSRLRKRMYRKLARMLHIACVITVSLVLIFILEMLTSLLSQHLFFLWTVTLYMVLLLVALFHRWF
jgi:hypothetical protein